MICQAIYRGVEVEVKEDVEKVEGEPGEDEDEDDSGEQIHRSVATSSVEEDNRGDVQENTRKLLSRLLHFQWG